MSQPTENLVRLFCTAPMSLRAATSTVDEPAGVGTLFGHFSVFNEWTEIDSYWEGRFLERIARGAFVDTFEAKAGQIRCLYDHGHDPYVGNKPLGTPVVLEEQRKGPYYEVELFDADYVRELLPAIGAGQMGASFRFTVTDETWSEPKEPTDHNPYKLKERTITGVELYEFGPVTFPAYANATAGLRSTTDQFLERLANDPAFTERFIRRVGPANAAEVFTTVAGAAPTPPAVESGASHATARGRPVSDLTLALALAKATSPR